MKKTIVVAVGLFITAISAHGAALLPVATGVEIRNIKILTDGSVDCTSPGSIAAATLQGKDDEQKIINFWNWYRRVEWHYKEWPERRDLTVNLMSQGQSLCGSHAALQMQVIRAGGFKTRPCFVEGGGHTFIEVFYDNRWHALDAMTGFYIYSRSEPHYIVSLAEMKSDPSLITNAVAEGRTPAVFLPCTYEPEIKKRKTLPWSHFKSFQETLLYYANGTKNSWTGSENDAYGGSFAPAKMNINLKPGEMVVKKWDLEPGCYPMGWAYPEDLTSGPFHRCGHNDEFDKVNFPYWEPYGKTNFFVYRREGTNTDSGPVTISRCYRYLANGRYIRELDAAKILALAAITNGVGITADGLAPSGVQTGIVELVTSFPYFICDAEITLKYRLLSDNSALVLQLMEKNRDKQPAPIAGRTLLEVNTKGAAVQTVRLGCFDYGKTDPRTYTLRLLLAGDARLENLNISTVFTHNMFTGPVLLPGKNKVTVTTENSEMLQQHPLVVTYRFADGENWTHSMLVQKEIKSTPYEFEIEVKGPKHPRMQSVSMQIK